MAKKSNQEHITSQMIADLANVSRATVSRVMKNAPYVKDSVRKHVQKIIDEYGYKPNYAGRALVRQKQRVKIGIIGLSTQNPLYSEMYKGAQQAADEFKGMGIEVVFRYTEDITCNSEIENTIDELMQEGITGLAILGVDDSNVQQAVQNVQDKIPVVTFNTNISNIKEFCFVGQNSKKSGRTAGAIMCELLKIGKVIVIANSLKVLAVSDRIAGFKEKLEEGNGNIQVLEIYENKSKDDLSYNIIKNIHQANQKIDGIYIASGFGSAGICKAIDEFKMQNIRIIAHDMLPDTVENVKKGKIAFTIGQELKTQGYLPIEILVKYLLMNEKPKEKKIYTKINIFNAENL